MWVTLDAITHRQHSHGRCKLYNLGPIWRSEIIPHMHFLLTFCSDMHAPYNSDPNLVILHVLGLTGWEGLSVRSVLKHNALCDIVDVYRGVPTWFSLRFTMVYFYLRIWSTLYINRRAVANLGMVNNALLRFSLLHLQFCFSYNKMKTDRQK